MLRGLSLMLQATQGDGLPFDPFSVQQGRDAQRPEFAIGFRYKNSSDGFRSVSLLPERKRQWRLLAHDVVSPPDAMIVSGHDGAARLRPPGLRQWVKLARHAVAPMTDGLPSAADAPLQRSELAKSAIYGRSRPQQISY